MHMQASTPPKTFVYITGIREFTKFCLISFTVRDIGGG